MKGKKLEEEVDKGAKIRGDGKGGRRYIRSRDK